MTRWIVDGMNVIGSRPDRWWNDPDRAVRRFIEELDRYASRTGEELTVVFDRRPRDVEPGRHGAVTVGFASWRGRNAADHEIVDMVAGHPSPGSLTVVTSDTDLARPGPRTGSPGPIVGFLPPPYRADRHLTDWMEKMRGDVPLEPGDPIRVRLVKPGRPGVEYPAVVIVDDGTHIVVEGAWAEDSARDLGFVRFEPGDVFTEHYWRDRWYSIKEVRGERGALKGWYCDVARPVRVGEDLLVSEDLDLDLWVSADGRNFLRLDEDEFAATGLSETDPETAAQARRALEELERSARAGFADVLPPSPTSGVL